MQYPQSLLPALSYPGVVQAPAQRARALRIDAARCFRLARGMASIELSDELEALGRAFEVEAEELAERLP